MARTQSVVLSLAEKKAMLADLKGQLKAMKMDEKQLAASLKGLTKDLTAKQKDMMKVQAKIDALTPPKVPASVN